MSELPVRIAARLYECRDAARRILGDRYGPAMTARAELIREASGKIGCGELQAASTIAKAMEQDGDAMQSVLILAAAVELLEPSQ